MHTYIYLLKINVQVLIFLQFLIFKLKNFFIKIAFITFLAACSTFNANAFVDPESRRIYC